MYHTGLPGGSAGRGPACRAGDLGSTPGWGSSLGEGTAIPTPVFWAAESRGLQFTGSQRVGHD